MKRFLFMLFWLLAIPTTMFTLWAIWLLSTHAASILAWFSQLARILSQYIILACLAGVAYVGWKAYQSYDAHQLERKAKRVAIEKEQHTMRLEQQRFNLTRDLALAGKLDGSNVEISETKLIRFLSQHQRNNTTIEAEQPAIAAPLTLPGPTLMIDVMRRWNLSEHNLFLGLGKGQKDIACTLDGFMHVAHDAPTGQGKCLEENEPIFLADGRVFPAKLLVGKTVNVIGVTDTKTMRQIPISASFTDNGIRTVVEIELDNGIVLKRTEEHPLWAACFDENQDVGLRKPDRNNRTKVDGRTRAIHARWVKAGDLQVCGNRPFSDGHVILCPTSLRQGGVARRGCEHHTDEEVALCAILLAEGGLTGHTPHFTSASQEIVALATRAVQAYGYEVAPKDRGRQPVIDYMIHNVGRVKGQKNKMRLLAQKWGIQGCNAYEKRVPPWVFRLPNRQVALFLRVFVDCDGWIDDGDNDGTSSVNVSLANAGLVQQIGQLALRFGIVGTYRHKNNGHAGAWTWSSPMVDVWEKKIGSLIKAEVLGGAVRNKAVHEEQAATDWDAWRRARPVGNQTFADCPAGYEWRKVTSIRYSVAPTVSIQVDHDTHAYLGYAVEHNTVQEYAEIIMLLKLGVRVILANPHFAPVGKKGEDWRPIGRTIEQQGKIEIAPKVLVPGLLRKPQNIVNMLLWLASTEIDRRFDMMARGDYRYIPLYLFIDEWPYIVSQYPDAAPALVSILQRGRAVEVCVDTNSQGFLIGDTSLKGSARENINTAYHMGGSVHSGSALLDMPVKDINALLKTEQIVLGRGVALLRNNQVAQQAELVRLPYANNEYAYYMLGRADDWTLPEFRNGKQVSPLTDAMAIEQDTPPITRDLVRDVSASQKPGEAARESMVSLTEQERLTIVAAARAQLAASGKEKVNRSQLLESQGWNNRMWPKVKQVLDEEGM